MNLGAATKYLYLVVGLALCFTVGVDTSAARPDDIKLNIQIRKSVATHWRPCGEYCNWKWLRCQLEAESSLDPFAVSPVGAVGIAQIMDGAWSDLKKHGAIPSYAKRTDWRWAVEGAAIYMERQRRIWISERPHRDRQLLSLACYNAGAGNVLDAQEACDGAVLYEPIIKCLPLVTGRHSRETINYVRRIERCASGVL